MIWVRAWMVFVSLLLVGSGLLLLLAPGLLWARMLRTQVKRGQVGMENPLRWLMATRQRRVLYAWFLIVVGGGLLALTASLPRITSGRIR
jgi:hypothetical protein